MSAAIPGLDSAPTTHKALLAWVRRVAELTTPDRVTWCDGSDQEWRTLTDTLVDAGTLVRLRDRPDSFWCASAPDDADAASDRTVICTRDENATDPHTWADPLDMKIVMTEHYRDCMTGRTMYVIPFCLGSPAADKPVLGAQITDSAYIAALTHITTRVGTTALALFDTAPSTAFLRCLHSVGAPLTPGQSDVPWPSDHTRYVSHFTDERMVWSYGSNHGDNALLTRTSTALRLASVIARDEGWHAEHMAILKLVSPDDTVHYLAAAFPSGTGATTLAMLEPGIPGWRIELVSDDIAWLRRGADGRLYATNPETGIAGRAPGTGWPTNPNAMRTLHNGHSIFTNVALTDDGGVWWEGYSHAPPDHVTTWTHRSWTMPDDWARGELAAHPHARYHTPITQCPTIAPEWDDPHGVPISAILLGNRRATTIPLVVESHTWEQGVFLAAIQSTDTTANDVHRDPMAMLPHVGYHIGDYLNHWIGAYTPTATLPRIFAVNWFRQDPNGHLLWPGFRDNARILTWIVQRLDNPHPGTATETPIGRIPTLAALDLTDLDTPPEQVQAALTVDPDEWHTELPLIETWFADIGNKLPTALHVELEILKHELTHHNSETTEPARRRNHLSVAGDKD